MRSEPRQHRALVSAPAADLQHTITGRKVKDIGHQRHDIGLGDRLPLTDWQRDVAVRVALLVGSDKGMAGHPAHRLHYPLAEHLATGRVGGRHGIAGDRAHHVGAPRREGVVVYCTGHRRLLKRG